MLTAGIIAIGWALMPFPDGKAQVRANRVALLLLVVGAVLIGRGA